MHSIIFELGRFKIASYGLMMAVGMLVGVWIGTVRAKKLGENPAVILDLTIWVVVAGIIGARFMYVFLEGWENITSKPFIETFKFFIRIRQGGLSFLGALMFSIPVGLIYLKRKKLNIWRIADIFGPSLAIGIAFARIGCFLNGCCFGKICSEDAFYGLEFPAGSIPYNHYHGIVTVYPTQLLNSLNALIIFIVLSIWMKYRKFDGQIFWLFVMIYCGARFMTDFLRGDSSESFFGGLLFGRFTLAQSFCFIGIITSIIMLIVLRKKSSPARQE